MPHGRSTNPDAWENSQGGVGWGGAELEVEVDENQAGKQALGQPGIEYPSRPSGDVGYLRYGKVP